MEAFFGMMIPFLGTTLGAACVFLTKRRLSSSLHAGLSGFAAGVMTAASIWSLLLPAIEQSAGLGAWQFVPASVGLWLGILFLFGMNRLLAPLYRRKESLTDGSKRITLMLLAVTLHNIPEGMAVGVAYAGYLSGNAQITAAGAFALAMGIAVQNFPEGAIVSMPLRAAGKGRGRAFGGGVLSGAVEPAAAVFTLLAARLVIPAMPWLLSFAAGAMLYVVVAELIPELAAQERLPSGALWFALGFSVMMALDVAFG